MPIFLLKHFSCQSCRLPLDEVAEWLRRWTANPMCSARVGSNPILVGILFATGGPFLFQERLEPDHGSMVLKKTFLLGQLRHLENKKEACTTGKKRRNAPQN